MLTLVEYGSPFFDKKIAKKYFMQNKKELEDRNGFEKLLFHSRFFNVYHNGYVGSVFVYEGFDGKKYIGGYAIRKRHQDVVEAIKSVSDMFDEVYAHTSHLNAVISLKKAGFKWYNRDKNILRRIAI